MFKHTMAAYNIIADDFRKLKFVFTLVTQAIFFIYSIYSIFTERGFLIANSIFAALALGYFVFVAFTYERQDKDTEKAKRFASRATKWVKLSVNLVTLSVMIYNAYFGITGMTVFSLVMLAFMVISWVVQVFAQIALYYVEHRLILFWHGMVADFEPVINVGTGISRVVRVVKGEDVEDGENAFTLPDKSREILSARVDADRQDRLEKKGKRHSWGQRIRNLGELIPKRRKGKKALPVPEEKEPIHKG